MTKREIVELITILQANYPDSFRGQSESVISAKISLWHKMFGEYPKEVVNAAAMAFMATDQKGFMPSVGQIMEEIRKLNRKDDRTPDEAWRLVYRAIQNSTYWAEEEFQKLPEDIRRFVGHPDQLKQWALMEADVVQSVIASNFQRSFRVRQQNDRDYQKLPGEVKQFVSRLTAGTFGYIDTGSEAIRKALETDISDLPYDF